MATAAITVALDQITKAIVRTSLRFDETVTVIPGIFDIAHVRNTGAAFGLLPGRQPLFIAVCILMLAAVALYWWRTKPRTWGVVIPLGLVVGGAIGNFIDRVFVGTVTDLLAFSFFSPVFNLADSAIFVGVATLIIWVLFGPEPPEAVADTDVTPALLEGMPSHSVEDTPEGGPDELSGDPTRPSSAALPRQGDLR